MAIVLFEADATEQYDGLPERIKDRIIKLVARLEKWPEVSGAKPLRGALSGHWRLRTGDYRLQFRAQGDVIVIEQVGHRDGFYE